MLRQGATENQCVELFFDQSVTFSASGPHDIQLCGQIASASSSPSPPSTTRTTTATTATSAKDSTQPSSDSDDDLDYQPGLDTGFGNSSSPSESESESDHEALGKVLARDAVGGKRKANVAAAASQDKAKKPKKNNGSDSSSSSSSDSDSDGDGNSEDDANDNTQSVTPQNKQGSKASIAEKLLQALNSLNKARSGAASADIGSKYRDLHGKGFKEDASMKLMKFVKENGQLFELTSDNLIKRA